MAKASPIQMSFNAGELSPYLEGRIDLSKYASGCHKLENYIPKVQGPAQKRSGTRHVIHPRGNGAGRFIPFEFNITQAYVLLFSHLRMIVLKDGGAVLDGSPIAITAITATDPPVLTSAGHPFSTNDQVYITGVTGMTELNGRYFDVLKLDANTYSLVTEDATTYDAYSAAGTAEAVVALTSADIPYSSSEIQDVYYTQSADTLILCHPNHAPRAITRTSHTAWSSDEITFDWPPFNPRQDDDTHTMTASDVTGAITITSSVGAYFTSDDVGRLIRIGVESSPGAHPDHFIKWVSGEHNALNQVRHYDGNVYVCTTAAVSNGSPPRHRLYGTQQIDGYTAGGVAGAEWEYRHSGWGYAVISAQAGFPKAVVNAVVVKEIPSLDPTTPTMVATANWSWGAWDDVSGYPSAVAFHGDRLWFFGSDAKPQSAWASLVGDYYNHELWDQDDYAMLFTLNTDRVNAIQWAVATQALVVGTAGGEFILAANSADDPIVPGDIDAKQHSTYGARAGVQPVRVEQVVLFAQRSGKKLREHVYDFDTDAFVAPDMTVLADHITAGLIDFLQFQQEPDRTVWASQEDGALSGMTYERAQEVVGWHRHPIGGTTVAVESIAVIPHPDGDQDQLWVLVRRHIDGDTVRYAEYLEKPWDRNDSVEDAFFCDSGVTVTGTAFTVINGLQHLEGETVRILGDGTIRPSKVVTNGKITLDDPADKVQVGLPYVATLGTMRLEAGSQDGTAQGKRGRVHRVVIRLDQTGAGLWYGPEDDISAMTELHMRDSFDAMDEAVPLFDGDTKELAWPGTYERPKRLYIKHDSPLPCTIVAIMPRVVVQDA